ncbi:LysR family transcriptional regulator [Hungatella hathewayi]
MNMRQLRYVLVLANEASFSRAANTLGITQPSLSQYIKKIEKQMGAALFDRTGGDVRLTDAGRVYIETGRKILDLEKQMERRFEDLLSFKSGSIVVGVSPHRCIHLMPEIAKRFKAKYPGMFIVVEERAGDSLLEDAEHGHFDLCISTLPVDEKVFIYKLMQKEEILLAVNKNTKLLKKIDQSSIQIAGHKYPAVDFRILAGEDFVMLSDNQLMQKYLIKVCQDAGIEVRRAMECRTIETQFAMVKVGMGVALVPSGISEFCDAENVTFFSFIQSIPFRDMAVIYRTGQYLSKPVRDLMDIMIHLDS